MIGIQPPPRRATRCWRVRHALMHEYRIGEGAFESAGILACSSRPLHDPDWRPLERSREQGSAGAIPRTASRKKGNEQCERRLLEIADSGGEGLEKTVTDVVVNGVAGDCVRVGS